MKTANRSLYMRAEAFLLSVIMILTGLYIPVSPKSSEFNAFAETSIRNINMEAVWQNDELDYTWNSYKDERRAVKITITYTSNPNIRDYDIKGLDKYIEEGEVSDIVIAKNGEVTKGTPKSDLIITVPGIGNALRKGVLKSKPDVDKWVYKYDSENDVYTFYWREEISKKMSMDGGFELSWTFNSRECPNYTQTITPTVTLKPNSGAEEMYSLPSMTYQFTNVMDNYNNNLKGGITDNETGGITLDPRDSFLLNADQEYQWREYVASIELNPNGSDGWNSRGLQYCRYFVALSDSSIATAYLQNGSDAPSWADPEAAQLFDLESDDLKVAIPDKESDWGYSYVDIEYDATRGQWGFYLLDNFSGDIKTKTYPFMIGFKPLEDVKKISDDSIEVDYEGNGDGRSFKQFEFDLDKKTQLTDDQKKNGINYTKLTNGNQETIDFELTASSYKYYEGGGYQYKPHDPTKTIEKWEAQYDLPITGYFERLYLDESTWTLSRLGDVTTITSDGTILDYDGNPIDTEQLRILQHYVLAKEYNETPIDDNPVGADGYLHEWDNYILAIEDSYEDMEVELPNGNTRSLDADEYSIKSVTMPQQFVINSRTGTYTNIPYPYTIYAIASDASETEVATSDTANVQTFPLPDGTCKLRIELVVPSPKDHNGISFSNTIKYSPIISVNYNLHGAFKTSGGIITNHDELQVKYYDKDEENNPITCLLPEIIKYPEPYSKTGAGRLDYDLADGKSDMLTNQDNFKIRDLELVLSSTAKFTSFDLPKRNTDYKLWSTITSSATISSEIDTAVNSITVYSVVPKDLNVGKLVIEDPTNPDDVKTLDGLYIDYSQTKLYKKVEHSDGTVSAELIDLDNVTIKPTYIQNAHNGEGLIAVEFIFTGATPQTLCLTDPNCVNSLSFNYQVYLENSEVWNDSVNHSPETYSYVYVDGIENSAGTIILKNSGKFNGETGAAIDTYNLDGDASTSTILAARGSATSEISTEVAAWDELAPKRVKSYFSTSGYTLAAFAKIYDATNDSDEGGTVDSAVYTYRLSLQLGNYAAGDLMLYDYLEMEQTDAAMQHLGTFLGLTDSTTGMKCDLYYTTDVLTKTPNYENINHEVVAPYYEYANYNSNITDESGGTKTWSSVWKPFDIEQLVKDLCLSDSAHSTTYTNTQESDVPNNEGGYYTKGQLAALKKITAIGVHVTLTNNAMIPAKSHLYADIQMLAPDDPTMDGYVAINRYYVAYHGYSTSSGEADRIVAANPVEVTFKAVVQSIKLTKLDAVTNAPMEGVTFKINEYDASKVDKEGNDDYTLYDWDSPKFKSITDDQGIAEFVGISRTKYVVQEYKEAALKKDNGDLYPLTGYYKLNEFVLNLELQNHDSGTQADCDEHFHKSWKQGEETCTVEVTNEHSQTSDVTVVHTVEYLYYTDDGLQTIILGDDHDLSEGTLPDGTEVGKTDIIHHYTIELKNERKTGNVILTKEDAQYPGRPVSSAIYRIYNGAGIALLAVKTADGVYQYTSNASTAGATYDLATGSNSTIEVDELPWNDYYFQEYKAPNGYEIDPYKHYVSIGREESESTVAIEPDEGNSKEDEKKQSIKLKKIDDSTGKPIVGATFKLWRADDFKKTLVSGDGDDAVYSYSLYADGEKPDASAFKEDSNHLSEKTDSNGEINISGLGFGWYRFEETATADGYRFPANPYSDMIHIYEGSYGKTVTVTMENEALPPSVRVYKTDEEGNAQEDAVFGLYQIMNPTAFKTILGKNSSYQLTGADLMYISTDGNNTLLTYDELLTKSDPSLYRPTYYKEDGSELQYEYYCLISDPYNTDEYKSITDYNALTAEEKTNYKKTSVPMINLVRGEIRTDAHGYSESVAESDSYDPLSWGSTYFFYETGSVQGFKITDPVEMFTLTTRMAEADPDNPDNLLYTYYAVNKQELGKVKLTKFLYSPGNRADATAMTYDSTAAEQKYAEFELHQDDTAGTLLFVRKIGDGTYQYLINERQDDGTYYLYNPQTHKLYAVAQHTASDGYQYYEASEDMGITANVVTDVTNTLTTCMTDTEYFGTIRITDLQWGAYYLHEITAPDGYKINPYAVRFAITEYTAVNEQSLRCDDELGTEGSINIEKNVNALYDAFGEASFVYTIKQTHKYESDNFILLDAADQKIWTKMLTISDRNTLSNSTVLTGLEAGVYVVKEVDAYRYNFSSVEIQGINELLTLLGKTDISSVEETDIDALTGLTDAEKTKYKNLLSLYQKDEINVADWSATVYLDLTNRDTETVHFENRLDDYSRYSHTDNRINHITSRQLTDVSIHYHGLKVLDPTTVGTDADGNQRSEFYQYDDTDGKYYYYIISEAFKESNNNWNNDNLTITLAYDDGTTETIDLRNENLKFYLNIDGKGKAQITDTGSEPLKLTTPYRFEAAGKHYYTYTIEYDTVDKHFEGSFTITVDLPSEPNQYYEIIYSANNATDTGHFGSNHNKVRNIVRYVWDETAGENGTGAFVECDKSRTPLGTGITNYMVPICSVASMQLIDWDYEKGDMKTNNGHTVYYYTDGEETKYCWLDGDEYKEITNSGSFYTETDTAAVIPAGTVLQKLLSEDLIQRPFKREDVETALRNKTTTQTTYVVYAKYSDERAMFVDGKKFNTILNNARISRANITGIEYSSNKPDNAVRVDIGIDGYTSPGITAEQVQFITDNKITQPIYMWQDGTILKWYSTDPYPYLNFNNITVNNANLGSNYFSSWTKLSRISAEGTNNSWNTSQCTNMRYMFSKSGLTETAHLQNWTTPNVSQIDYIFDSCTKLSTVTNLNWDISNVTSLERMFYECKALQKIENVTLTDKTALTADNGISASQMFSRTNDNNSSTFDTISKLTIDSHRIQNCYAMFQYSKVKQILDFKINTENVTTMASMFENCGSLVTLSLDKNTFKAGDKLTTVASMFKECQYLTGLDLRGFGNCSNLTSINSWFYNCQAISYIDLANFETSTKLNDITGVLFHTSENTGNTCLANTGCAVFAKGKWINSAPETTDTKKNPNYDFFRINMYGKMYKNSNEVTLSTETINRGSPQHLDIQAYYEKTDGTPDYDKLSYSKDNQNYRIKYGYFNDANSTYYTNWAAAKYGTE